MSGSLVKNRGGLGRGVYALAWARAKQKTWLWPRHCWLLGATSTRCKTGFTWKLMEHKWISWLQRWMPVIDSFCFRREETKNTFQMQIRAKCEIRLRSLRKVCEEKQVRWLRVLLWLNSYVRDSCTFSEHNCLLLYTLPLPTLFLPLAPPCLSRLRVSQLLHWIEVKAGELLLHRGSSEGTAFAVDVLSVNLNSGIKKMP